MIPIIPGHVTLLTRSSGWVQWYNNISCHTHHRRIRVQHHWTKTHHQGKYPGLLHYPGISYLNFVQRLMRRRRITKDEIGINLGGEEPTLVHFPLEMCGSFVPKAAQREMRGL